MATPETTETDLPITELFGAVYRFFYNKTFGLSIILTMAVLTFLGVLFPQAPDTAVQSPEMWASWLDSVRPRFAGFTNVLAALTIFRMFQSWPFMLVTALLALSILACTAHRAPNLWRQATAPHIHVGDNFFAKSRFHEEAQHEGSTAEAFEAVSTSLRKRRYRIIKDGDSGRFYADKNRWAPLGTVAAHIAFDIILIGVLVSSFSGFRDENVVVPVGTGVEVGHDTGLVVTADNFIDTYYDDGRPKDYASDVHVTKNGQEVGRQTIRVNSPLRVGDVTFNQMTFGVASEIEIRDTATGTVLDHRVIPLDFQTQDGVNVYGTYKLPEKNLEVYVVGVAAGQQDSQIKPGQVLVEIYEDGSKKPAGSAALSPATPQKLTDKYTVNFARERAYTSLQVARDPGRIWVWIGCGLLLLGMCATMFLRHRRIWGKIDHIEDSTVVTLASPDRADRAFEQSLQAIARELSSTTKKNG